MAIKDCRIPDNHSNVGGSNTNAKAVSSCLILSATMLESFWRRTIKENPGLTDHELEMCMFQRLRTIEKARNRLGKSWMKLYRE